MAERTDIYENWNPWHGCTKVSPGCKYCYVYRQDEMYGSEVSSSECRKTGSFYLPIKRRRDKSWKIESGKVVFTCFTSDFLLADADMWRKECWQMMKQRSGRIINMSSVVGISGNAGQINYAASKAGVIGMTKSAAKELASRGITVNAIAPGYIETDMTNVLSDKVKEETMKQIPLGRLGQTGDIAAAAAFLASDEAGYITGQVLAVDGGMAI